MPENSLQPVEHLTDQELLTRAIQLARGEARVTSLLVAHLAEIDARRLYLSAGFPSLFAYCVRELRLSEAAAYRRINAARLARRFPLVLDLLASGATHLAALSIVGPLLTSENHHRVLQEAIGRTSREVEELATLWRSPIGESSGGRLSVSSSSLPGLFDQPSATGGPPEEHAPPPKEANPELPPAAQEAPAIGAPGQVPTQAVRLLLGENGAVHDPVSPRAPARSRLVLYTRPETRSLLFEARDLLRHALPDGDLDSVVSRALKLLVRSLRARKYGEQRGRERPRAASSPQGEGREEPVSGPGGEMDTEPESAWPAADLKSLPGEGGPRNRRSRYVPTTVRREVWRRDGGRCTFTSHEGRRCEATAQLEFHHLIPFARGGASSTENMELRCRAHNQYEEPEWRRPGRRNLDLSAGKLTDRAG